MMRKIKLSHTEVEAKALLEVLAVYGVLALVLVGIYHFEPAITGLAIATKQVDYADHVKLKLIDSEELAVIMLSLFLILIVSSLMYEFILLKGKSILRTSKERKNRNKKLRKIQKVKKGITKKDAEINKFKLEENRRREEKIEREESEKDKEGKDKEKKGPEEWHDLEKSLKELGEIFEQRKKEKKPGIIQRLVKREKKAENPEEAKAKVELKKKLDGKSRAFINCHKLLSIADKYLQKKDILKAKRLYLKTRNMYIKLEYLEKKEIYSELTALYNKLSKARK